MKIYDLYVVCAPSINESNTWYIFRSNGVEVEIKMIKNEFKANRVLTEMEVEYLNNNLR